MQNRVLKILYSTVIISLPSPVSIRDDYSTHSTTVLWRYSSIGITTHIPCRLPNRRSTQQTAHLFDPVSKHHNLHSVPDMDKETWLESEMKYALRGRAAKGSLRVYQDCSPNLDADAPSTSLDFSSNDYLGLARDTVQMKLVQLWVPQDHGSCRAILTTHVN
jgi:hypothetical protein